MPPPIVPPPMEGHVGDDPCELFVRLRRPPRCRLCLPTPFTSEMELDPPESLRLHMRGCWISGMRARVDFPAPHVMYLGRGWKTFAHIHRLMAGLTLHFKLMEGGLLSVKVFGCFGTRARCCVESSSDSEDSSSGGCGSSSICTWPLLRQGFAGGGASSLNFSRPSPWAAGVGRLCKRKRAGGKAVNLEYAGTDAFDAR